MKNTHGPTISIIIPFFNREMLLGETIDSVLSQTYTNWKLILVDDGSTDAGAEVARNYVARFPERILIAESRQGVNQGASAARNRGVALALGDLILFLDSDDILLPDALTTFVAAFSNNPAADVVCGAFEYWYSWNQAVGKKEQDFLVNLGVPAGKTYEPPSLLIHNLRSGGRKPGMGCVIFKRSLFGFGKLFKDRLKEGGEDQMYWAILCLNGRVHVLDELTMRYRQHADSTYTRSFQQGKAAKDWLLFLECLEEHLDQYPTADPQVRASLVRRRKEIQFWNKFDWLLRHYRNLLPLRIRYAIRDILNKIVAR